MLGGVGLGVGLGALGAISTAIGGVSTFLYEAGKAASDLNETQSKLTAVFPAQAAAIRAWAKDSATAMGLSTQAALEAVGTFGNFLEAMGQVPDVAADMSRTMVQLAADLGSFNNESPEDVLLALRSGLSGETEPLRKFGVDISDAAVQTELLATGVKKTATGFTQAQKIQGRYNLIMRQTVRAQGDFGRTASGTANATKIAAAQTENFKAKLGELVNNIQNVAVALAGTAALALTNALDAVGDSWNNLMRAIVPGLAFEEDVDAAIRSMAESLGLNADALIAYSNQQRQFAKDAQAAADAQELVNTKVDDFRASLEAQGVTGDALEAQVKGFRDGMLDVAVATDDATKAQTENEKAMAAAKTMVDAFVAAGMPVPPAMQAIADGATDVADTVDTKLTPAIKAVIPTIGELTAAVGSIVTATAKIIPKTKGHAARIKYIFHHALTDTRDDIKLRMREINHLLANPDDQKKLRKTLVKGMEDAAKARLKAQKAGNTAAFAAADAEYEYLKGRVADIDALNATIKVGWDVEKFNRGEWGDAFTRTHPKTGIPQHKGGLAYVPHDRYLMYADRGERVLTAAENAQGSWSGTRTLNVVVTSPDRSLQQSNMTTADLANHLRRWEDG